MAGFVADASATLPWCFTDEATSWSEDLLARVERREPMFVPAHWIVEVTNAVRMAERKGRLAARRAEGFLDKLENLRPHHQPTLTIDQAKMALSLSRKHRLTGYDAIYLELAMRLGLELATLDGELISAALSEGVELC